MKNKFGDKIMTECAVMRPKTYSQSVIKQCQTNLYTSFYYENSKQSRTTTNCN